LPRESGVHFDPVDPAGVLDPVPHRWLLMNSMAPEGFEFSGGAASAVEVCGAGRAVRECWCLIR
jgi:hypothetical protein